jgi:hypothetical protein
LQVLRLLSTSRLPVPAVALGADCPLRRRGQWASGRQRRHNKVQVGPWQCDRARWGPDRRIASQWPLAPAICFVSIPQLFLVLSTALVTVSDSRATSSARSFDSLAVESHPTSQILRCNSRTAHLAGQGHSTSNGLTMPWALRPTAGARMFFDPFVSTLVARPTQYEVYPLLLNIFPRGH